MKEAISLRAGIIGGLGPETSSKFCLNVNMKFRDITKRQPDLVMENLPIPADAEKKLITGRPTGIHRILLRNAVIRLNNAEVDFIAIPCNTVHCFLRELRSISKRPIISIIEECVKECQNKNFRKVGLLATSKTIKDELFKNECKEKGIELLVPDSHDQKILNNIILRILNNVNTRNDKKEILRIVKQLGSNGVEAVILGCTDLSLIISKNDCSIPILETDKILEDSLVQNLLIGC